MQTRQVNVQRWSITSQKPFDAVLAAVEGAIGKPNMMEFASKMAATLTYQEMQKVVNDSVGEIGLMEFMRLDHGAVLRKAGGDGNRKSVRLIVGRSSSLEQSDQKVAPDVVLGVWTSGWLLSSGSPNETSRSAVALLG